MTKYTIIEDGSPYFIKFKFDGLDEIVKQLNDVHDYISSQRPDCYVFSYWSNIPSPQCDEIMAKLPFPTELDISSSRLALWLSEPGWMPMAHKDGEKNRWGINFGVNIKDDKVPTEWYDEQEMLVYELDETKCSKGRGKRETKMFKRQNHVPIKTGTLLQNEAMLVNTDLFHSWNHLHSPHKRLTLVMRTTNPGDVYFDDVKRILFPELDNK